MGFDKVERRQVVRKQPVINKLLIVDDNVLDVMMLKRLLTNYVREISSVGTLAECLDRVRKEEFTFVLLDVVLPDGNGLEEYGKIKGMAGNAQVILMSSYGDVHEKDKVTNYLVSEVAQKAIGLLDVVDNLRLQNDIRRIKDDLVEIKNRVFPNVR